MSTSPHILICDDDPIVHESLALYMDSEHFTHSDAYDGREALNMAAELKPDLILLDVMMPEMSGLDVCRELRKTITTPIIILTAKGEENDVLNGFELGADEYINKPFSPKILMARVNAVLRRSTDDSLGKKVVEAGGIQLDVDAHVATNDGNPVELSVKEFELLYYFINNEGIALSREKILNHVWDYDYFGDARTIDTHVKKLRSKLDDKGNYIKTIWGMGYKFEVDAKI